MCAQSADEKLNWRHDRESGIQYKGDTSPVVKELVSELASAGPWDDVSHFLTRLTRYRESQQELMSQFPGAVWFDPNIDAPLLPSGSQVSGIAKMLIQLGTESEETVLALLDHQSPRVRFYAALVAAELNTPRMLEGVTHMLMHERSETRRIARRVLVRFAKLGEYQTTLATLRATVVNWKNTTPKHRKRALETLLYVRDPASPSVFVAALRDDNRMVARRAHHALVVITAHDFGPMHRPWQRWLSKNAGTTRPQWLIKGLSDRRENVRYTAAKELQACFPEANMSVEKTSPLEAYLHAQATYQKLVGSE